MSKNLDETVRLQSEKRGERLQGIAEGVSSAPRLASSSPASFPGRNECPGTHYSLIEQKREDRFAREIEVKGNTEERTEQGQIGGGEKRSGRLVGAAETSKEHAEWRRLQRKSLNILCLLKRKEWPQCHRESSWQVRQSRPCQKEKEQSRLSRVPDHEGGGSRWARAAPWQEKADQSGSMKRNGWTSQ